ncbi:MAG TPA: nickel/cobalt efflux transporter [Steroidobacteraceae bacterium]|nr:nickel/cobalt efflux transporter [Steroidobacteraceae bacterium]
MAMTGFTTLLAQGNSWLFVPSAVLLGALHGLEPGHSKTMMAAFIVAIRGTPAQATLLGLSATVSHTAIVWAIALTGLYFGRSWNSATAEPYFQVVSALLIICVAAWMLWRTRRESRARADYAPLHAHHHDHVDSDDHGHHHEHPQHGREEARRIDTGQGVVRLAIFEDGVPPRFRLHAESGYSWPAGEVQLETERADGSRELFGFRRHGGYLESTQTIPAPHEFVARLRLGSAGHTRDFDLEFVEGRHRHAIQGYQALDVAAPGYRDPHELAHANDIRKRFADRPVTTGQIVLFGLTGGLMPCPASITVLLLCLQLKRVALGATLVLCFSIGLALTMVATGAVAALGMQHAARRFSGFGELTRKAPYFSGAVIMLVGFYVGYQGLSALAAARV